MTVRRVPLSGSWFRARFVVNTALIIACTAMMIPFGPRDHRYSYALHHSYFQIVLNALALVAAIGLVIDLLSPHWARTEYAWPYILTCFTFMAQAVYNAFEPHVIAAAKVSQFLIYFGAAYLSAGGWYLRRMNYRAGYLDRDEAGSW